MKKSVSVILCVVLVFSCVFTAFATGLESSKVANVTNSSFEADGVIANYSRTELSNNDVILEYSSTRGKDKMFYDYSTGKVTLNGEIIATITEELMTENYVKNTEKANINAVNTRASWKYTEDPFYGEASDYNKYIGVYKGNINLEKKLENYTLGALGVLISFLVPPASLAVAIAGVLITCENAAEVDKIYYKKFTYNHKHLSSLAKKIKMRFYYDSKYNIENKDARSVHYETYVGSSH